MKQSKPLMRARSSLIFHPSSLRPGFTLTEVLIVIGIIVLVLALAVPALDIISGSRSINGAENNVSAMLGRARADAIGVQEVQGVLFFIDPDTQRVTLAQVRQVDSPAAVVEAYLDLVPDRDFFLLPKGVSVQVIDNCDVTGSVRADDGYIGFNREAEAPTGLTLTQYGGVILFDGKGQLVSRSYGFRSVKDVGGVAVPTAIFNLLYAGSIVPDAGDPTPPVADMIPANNQPAPGSPMLSAFGFVLFELEPFLNNWNVTDPQANAGTMTYDAAELAEEQWLDQNAVPLMINRYNGTLLRGE